MRRGSCILAAPMLLGTPILASGTGGCHFDVRAEDNGLLSLSGKPLGPPVIAGDSAAVPAYRLRFVDAVTRSVLRPSKVSIAYGWKWLQYPYPEHSWGAWSIASDIVTCVEAGTSEVAVPQFEVKPRGWYDGKYTKFPFSRRPSFNGIDITAVLKGCSPRVTIRPKEVSSLVGRTVVVKVACNGESTISYEK